MLVGIALSTGAAPAGAQHAARRGSGDLANVAVRAELAGVLLQSGRYDEAAHEFRTLLARHGDVPAYRLGLARALAWGGHAREAEGELRRLAARRYASATVDTLLRAVRQEIAPSAAEAAGWVAERPDYAPYRLALARALAREGHGFLAAAQYDTLMPEAGVGSIPQASALIREKAAAYAAAGTPARAVNVLLDAVALSPADTGLRHGLALMLRDQRDGRAAVAQYDTLLVTVPTAELYRERGELHAALNEASQAELDLRTSVALVPTVSAYLALGDLYRDAGDYPSASDAYRAASSLPARSAADRRAIAAARAQLAREERPPVALFPVVGEDPGWRATADAAEDNVGVRYAQTRARRGEMLGHGFTGAVGFESRTIGENVFGATTRTTGFGLDAGLGHAIAFGPWLLRTAVDGGVLGHPLINTTMFEGRAAAALAFGAWQGAAEMARGPAYPSLLSVESVIYPGAAALLERDLTGTVAGPVGPLDIAGSLQRSTFTDGNTRLVAQAYARLPLNASLALLYAASGTRFAERSARYWDPIRYISNAVGLELSRRGVRGLSFAARVLPEYARSREAVAPSAADSSSWYPSAPAPWERTEIIRRSALQLGASAELSYRAPRWELEAALAHGRGRAGEYQRTAASVGIRLLP